jgi:hypothetical protein
MRRVVIYMAAGLMAISVVELFAPSSGPGLSVNARSVVPAGATLQYVDRSHKGDRLDMSVTSIGKRPIWKMPAKIMLGCDPAFSPLSASAAHANFPGRCAT